jgi:DNA-3-methyladenine glycosylase
MNGISLPAAFFDRDPQVVAKALLGKVLCHLVDGAWLGARIIETEAYYRRERASHASLGYTEKRKALFMPPGTVYMYYARGGDSFNVSCRGAGNAVLLKAGLPYAAAADDGEMVARMQRLNPLPSGKPRPPERLCSGQTLLCRSLGLRVPDWDQQQFRQEQLRLLDVGLRPARFIRTTRLGIPPGRDGHLPYRYVDYDHAAFCTRNPLSRRKQGKETVAFLPGRRP